MNVSPDDMSRILRGARLCPDSHRDWYFAYCAERIKFFREPIPQIVTDALRRLGQTNSSSKPRRKT
jgi:hypothetical protein